MKITNKHEMKQVLYFNFIGISKTNKQIDFLLLFLFYLLLSFKPYKFNYILNAFLLKDTVNSFKSLSGIIKIAKCHLHYENTFYSFSMT